MSPKAST